MTARPTALERAFQLARMGRVPTTERIRQALKQEGYKLDQLTGPSLLKQLRKAIRQAGGAPPR